MTDRKVTKAQRAGVTRRNPREAVTLPDLPVYEGKPCYYLNRRLYVGDECVRIRPND